MPEHDLVVVVNATPLIALSLVGRLDLLHALYGRIVIPPAVRQEVLDGKARAPGVEEVGSADWIMTRPLQCPAQARLIPDLDLGETEVLALALELNADLVIMDERLGRRHARRLGLPMTGTLGVLTKAKRKGLIPVIRPLIAGMQTRGFRLADDLIARALAMSGEAP